MSQKFPLTYTKLYNYIPIYILKASTVGFVNISPDLYNILFLKIRKISLNLQALSTVHCFIQISVLEMYACLIRQYLICIFNHNISENL